MELRGMILALLAGHGAWWRSSFFDRIIAGEQVG
jgi:hypothetical protein